jgi:hypothetical protein
MAGEEITGFFWLGGPEGEEPGILLTNGCDVPTASASAGTYGAGRATERRIMFSSRCECNECDDVYYIDSEISGDRTEPTFRDGSSWEKAWATLEEAHASDGMMYPGTHNVRGSFFDEICWVTHCVSIIGHDGCVFEECTIIGKMWSGSNPYVNSSVIANIMFETSTSSTVLQSYIGVVSNCSFEGSSGFYFSDFFGEINNTTISSNTSSNLFDYSTYPEIPPSMMDPEGTVDTQLNRVLGIKRYNVDISLQRFILIEDCIITNNFGGLFYLPEARVTSGIMDIIITGSTVVCEWFATSHTYPLRNLVIKNTSMDLLSESDLRLFAYNLDIDNLSTTTLTDEFELVVVAYNISINSFSSDAAEFTGDIEFLHQTNRFSEVGTVHLSNITFSDGCSIYLNTPADPLNFTGVDVQMSNCTANGPTGFVISATKIPYAQESIIINKVSAVWSNCTSADGPFYVSGGTIQTSIRDQIRQGVRDTPYLSFVLDASTCNHTGTDDQLAYRGIQQYGSYTARDVADYSNFCRCYAPKQVKPSLFRWTADKTPPPDFKFSTTWRDVTGTALASVTYEQEFSEGTKDITSSRGIQTVLAGFSGLAGLHADVNRKELLQQRSNSGTEDILFNRELHTHHVIGTNAQNSQLTNTETPELTKDSNFRHEYTYGGVYENPGIIAYVTLNSQDGPMNRNAFIEKRIKFSKDEQYTDIHHEYLWKTKRGAVTNKCTFDEQKRKTTTVIQEQNLDLAGGVTSITKADFRYRSFGGSPDGTTAIAGKHLDWTGHQATRLNIIMKGFYGHIIDANWVGGSTCTQVTRKPEPPREVDTTQTIHHKEINCEESIHGVYGIVNRSCTVSEWDEFVYGTKYYPGDPSYGSSGASSTYTTCWDTYEYVTERRSITRKINRQGRTARRDLAVISGKTVEYIPGVTNNGQDYAFEKFDVPIANGLFDRQGGSVWPVSIAAQTDLEGKNSSKTFGDWVGWAPESFMHLGHIGDPSCGNALSPRPFFKENGEPPGTQPACFYNTGNHSVTSWAASLKSLQQSTSTPAQTQASVLARCKLDCYMKAAYEQEE